MIKYNTTPNNSETQFYEACVNSVVLVMTITVATDNFVKEINFKVLFKKTAITLFMAKDFLGHLNPFVIKY